MNTTSERSSSFQPAYPGDIVDVAGAKPFRLYVTVVAPLAGDIVVTGHLLDGRGRPAGPRSFPLLTAGIPYTVTPAGHEPTYAEPTGLIARLAAKAAGLFKR